VVYTWYIPVIYRMSEFGIQNQLIFLAVYASLICAVTMSSQEPASRSELFGATKSSSYVCAMCQKRGMQGIVVPPRAIHVHMSRSKICCDAEVKKITVTTRPGDVIAGGSGGMGPCPPPQHHPPGIGQTYTCHIPVIYLVYISFMVYTCCIPDI
jgi:hypothetical protein